MRYALLLCAAFTAALCFACVAAAPPPVTSGGRVGIRTATVPQCTATSFLANVSWLNNQFSPGPGMTPPTGSSFPTGNGVPNYAGDLTMAFNAASPAFQQQLCNLDAVYINGANANPQHPSCPNGNCFAGSWGWLQSVPTGTYGRIIALSADLWGTANYSGYESALMSSLVPPPITYTNAQSCWAAGSSNCTSLDGDMTMAVLAALAHEMGHIGWYAVIDPLSDPTNFCGGLFFSNSWVTPIHKPPPDDAGHPWRNLLTQNERNHLRQQPNKWLDKHRNPPHIDAIDNPPGGGPTPNQSIFGLINKPAPWASLFAAMAPDEDFIETYKFAVLTTAKSPVTSVAINVPGGGSANIAADYFAGGKAELARKVGCVPMTF